MNSVLHGYEVADLARVLQKEEEWTREDQAKYEAAKAAGASAARQQKLYTKWQTSLAQLHHRSQMYAQAVIQRMRTTYGEPQDRAVIAQFATALRGQGTRALHTHDLTHAIPSADRVYIDQNPHWRNPFQRSYPGYSYQTNVQINLVRASRRLLDAVETQPEVAQALVTDLYGKVLIHSETLRPCYADCVAALVNALMTTEDPRQAIWKAVESVPQWQRLLMDDDVLALVRCVEDRERRHREAVQQQEQADARRYREIGERCLE